jgi:hypothetical protein
MEDASDVLEGFAAAIEHTPLNPPFARGEGIQSLPGQGEGMKEAR